MRWQILTAWIVTFVSLQAPCRRLLAEGPESILPAPGQVKRIEVELYNGLWSYPDVSCVLSAQAKTAFLELFREGVPDGDPSRIEVELGTAKLFTEGGITRVCWSSYLGQNRLMFQIDGRRYVRTEFYQRDKETGAAGDDGARVCGLVFLDFERQTGYTPVFGWKKPFFGATPAFTVLPPETHIQAVFCETHQHVNLPDLRKFQIPAKTRSSFAEIFRGGTRSNWSGNRKELGSARFVSGNTCYRVCWYDSPPGKTLYCVRGVRMQAEVDVGDIDKLLRKAFQQATGFRAQEVRERSPSAQKGK